MNPFTHGLLSGLGIGLFTAALLHPLIPTDGPASLRLVLAFTGIAVALISTITSKRAVEEAEVFG